MKKRKLLFTMLALSLGCLSGGSGAMAQTSWDYVYTQEETTSDTWTALSEGSTTGMTLGSSGTTSYYRLTKSLNFTNTNVGGSGLTIKGTVYLYLPAGVNITCVGANASGATGAGAGIELTEGNTLYIIGGGNGATVTATGGNAANGGNGGNGQDAAIIGGWDECSGVAVGGGGAGGNGGGGAKGSQDRESTGYYGFESCGGRGGINGDGTYADAGGETRVSWQAITDGICLTNAEDSWLAGAKQEWRDDLDSKGGYGGATGNTCANGMTNTGEKTYTITLQPTKTKVNGKNLDAVTMTYAPSTLTTFILPKNKSGYQWALLIYGKSCKADGTASSVFTTATKEFFGGEEEDEAYRTIILNDVYGDLTFVEVATTCKLKNTGDNSETLADFFYNEEIMSNKYPVAVRLVDRTLYQDNHWNTLCLPFDMTPSQINISILQGASIYEMDAVNTGYYANGQNVPLLQYKKDGPVLLLAFNQVNYQTYGLQAGKPYLVKWTSGSNFVDNTHDGNTKHEVEFYNVTVTRLAPDVVYGNGVSFQGTFSSSPTLSAGDKQYLMLGANDKLYYPSKNINVSACRGYFIIPALATSTAPEIVMDFDGDEMTTSIQTLDANGAKQDDNGAVYNLNGQRLSAPQKGINIVNGKKVLVK